MQFGSEGDDAQGIETGTVAVIPLFVERHVDGFAERGRLVQVPQVARKIGIIDDAAQVALEVAVVNRVPPSCSTTWR